MCCSGFCMQKFVKYSGIVLSLIGLGIITFCIVILVQNQQVEEASDILAVKDAFMIVLLVIGSILLMVGACGSCGSIRQNLTCLKCFRIFNTIMFFIILILTIIAVTLTFVVSDAIKDQESCKESGWSTYINQYNEKAGEIFCSQDCPCYVSDPVFQMRLISGQKNKTATLVPEHAKTVLDCPNFEQETRASVKGNYTSLIRSFENNYKCSGFCIGHMNHIFIDVNNGEPVNKQGCAKELANDIEENGLVYSIILIIICIFVFLNSLMSCLLSRKDMEKENMQRQAKYQEVQIKDLQKQKNNQA